MLSPFPVPSPCPSSTKAGPHTRCVNEDEDGVADEGVADDVEEDADDEVEEDADDEEGADEPVDSVVPAVVVPAGPPVVVALAP